MSKMETTLIGIARRYGYDFSITNDKLKLYKKRMLLWFIPYRTNEIDVRIIGSNVYVLVRPRNNMMDVYAMMDELRELYICYPDINVEYMVDW